MDWVIGTTVIASAVLGGVFFAFSTFVMPGLRALPARDGIVAMQRINIAAPRSLLLLPLLVSAIGSGVIAIHALIGDDVPHQMMRLAAAVLGVACFIVTIVANVPRNNVLAEVAPSEERAAAEWTAYLTTWTRWNHVRTIAAITSAALLAALLRLPG
jgi:uncharacterized membrane protein